MKRIVILYGLLMFTGLVSFFLIMHVLNLSHHYNLRLFNGVIHMTFIALAIRDYHRLDRDRTTYMNDVAAGVLTSTVGVFLFCVFQFFFLSINTNFMAELRGQLPDVAEYLNPFTAVLTIFMEGIAASVIGSYILTRIIEAAMARRMTNVGHEGHVRKAPSSTVN